MQAILYETLRKTSSPIVPHVASEDTAIAGKFYTNEKNFAAAIAATIMNQY